MEEDVVIAAEACRLVLGCGAHHIAVEVGLALVAYAQQVRHLVSVGGRVGVWSEVGVKRELTEERPHAACHARHRTEP